MAVSLINSVPINLPSDLSDQKQIAQFVMNLQQMQDTLVGAINEFTKPTATPATKIDPSWIPTPTPPVVTQVFLSTAQAITAAGALTLAHGFTGGLIPRFFQVFLKCVTAEGGFSIGDITPVDCQIKTEAGVSVGVQIIPDATNLNIRYGSNGNTFIIGNKTTGSIFVITNANWNALFYTWG